MRINGTLRAAAAPALLLAATAAAGGTAHAAGQDFQFFGTDDKVHAIHDPAGCFDAAGGAGGGVVNGSDRRAVLYAGEGCAGRVVGVVEPGASAPVGPAFGSVHFPVTR
ncbi:hypothetical protein ACIQUQ_25130 [Streptomyces sp. NPDC101118]|uniref:hypothetical protein n=1 Tax=Streptomyces sp. NPDC101118 TaxID=3366109 RepID=UPI0038054D43